MSERPRDDPRAILRLARDASRRLGHGYLGAEHLLLGLLRAGECRGARILADLGLRPEAVVAALEAVLPQGSEARGTGQLPFTPRAKRVLEHGLAEGTNLGHDRIGSEHLLLGLLRESEGVAGATLASLGVDAAAVRRAARDLRP